MAETRELIRLRHEMNPQFVEKNRKRGIQQVYYNLAERLYENGRGAWPLRFHQQVAQKWNNLIGAYKVRLVLDNGSEGGPAALQA